MRTAWPATFLEALQSASLLEDIARGLVAAARLGPKSKPPFFAPKFFGNFIESRTRAEQAYPSSHIFFSKNFKKPPKNPRQTDTLKVF